MPYGYYHRLSSHRKHIYRLSDRWRVSTGFAYDSSAVDTKNRNAALPVDRQIRVGVGAIHDWSEHTTIGMSFMWLNLGDAKLNNQFVKGEYERHDIFFLGLNVNWAKLPWAGRATF